MSPKRSIFLPTTAPTITIACDGACITTSKGPAGGYGVYLNHPPYTASICEPLPESHKQDSQSAEVKALHSALELIHALRPHRVLLFSDSQYAVRGYNEWMYDWRANDWLRYDGNKLANRGLWKAIIQFPDKFGIRGIKVDVVWKPRNSTPELVEADRLARMACSLNQYCSLCCSFVGRVGTSHECHPVCNIGNCNRRFVDVEAYNNHYADTHVLNRPCRRHDCDLVFGSEKAALSHERMAHGWYIFDCGYCDLMFQDEHDRDEHIFTDCQYSPYCRICDRWFRSLNAMLQHDYAVH